MVKIVDPGPDPSVVKQVVCKQCGARLEYVPRDIREHNSKDIDGGMSCYQYIDCPQCQHRIILRTW